jgi:uncharacterized membrane protein SpoIIM required for sporulation
MSELGALYSRRFRQEHEADWRRLEALLTKLESGSLKALGDDEIIALPALYRSALSSLSIARAVSLDSALLVYLEGLSARAYFAVYGVRKSGLELISFFLTQTWPQSVRMIWRETLAAGLFLLGGAVLAYVMTLADPSNFALFMPEEMANGRGPGASRKALEAVLTEGATGNPMAFFASFLFTHNAQIALLAFALGALAGVPTVLLLIQNGLGVGALAAVYARQGLLAPLGGWLLIHGTTELSAVILAGGCGLKIAVALVFPGATPRLEAVRRAMGTVGAVMAGVVLMLFVAGLLEGFGRQIIQDLRARYAVALAALGFWTLYFVMIGRRRS